MRLTPGRTLVPIAVTVAAAAASGAAAVAQEPLKTPETTLSYSYERTSPRITFSRVTLRSVPADATVVVRCLTAGGDRCKGALRKAFRATGVSGTVEVERFTDRRIRPGRRLVARIAAPGYLTMFKTVRVTRTGAPPIVTECAQPGSGERGPC